MRAFEFLIEKLATSQARNPSTVQAKIQSRISKIFDIKELNQIYSYVSKVDIGKGFDAVFARDPDLRHVQSTLSHAIVNSTAAFEDKLGFAKELATGGIINLELLMKPGVPQKITNLVTTQYPEIYQEVAPTLMSIAGKFQVKDKTLNRGKGEFFLALLSPAIRIGGAGDITIDGQGYEVKDNEGRMYGSSSAYGKVEPGIKAAQKELEVFIKTNKLELDPKTVKVTLGPKSNLYSMGPQFVQMGVNHTAVRQLVVDAMTHIITSLYPSISTEQLAGFHSSVDGNGVVNWANFKGYLKQFVYSYYQKEAKFAGMFLFNSQSMSVTYVTSPEMFAELIDISYGFYSSQQQGVQVYTPNAS